jgi:hypothetical protein
MPPQPLPQQLGPRQEPTVQTYFPEPIVESRGSGQRTLGWIVTGIGAAGLGVGAGFGILSLSKRDQANPHCVNDFCNADGVALREDAIQAGNVATITSIAGGAVLLGGILLVATAPSSTETRRETAGRATAQNRLQPSFSVAPAGGSIGLSGTLP